jgi:colicin import membrane protein
MQFAGKYAGRGSATGQQNRTTAMDKVKAKIAEKKEGMTMKERAEENRRRQAEKAAEKKAREEAAKQAAKAERKAAAQARNQAAIAKNKAKQAKLSGRAPKA